MNQADKERKIIAWMQKKGFDRKMSQMFAPIMYKYLTDHQINHEKQLQEISDNCEKYIRTAVTETSIGVFEWIKEETDVVDKRTKRVLNNVELDLKPNRKKLLEAYVWPRLAKHGIVFEQK